MIEGMTLLKYARAARIHQFLIIHTRMQKHNVGQPFIIIITMEILNE